MASSSRELPIHIIFTYILVSDGEGNILMLSCGVKKRLGKHGWLQIFEELLLWLGLENFNVSSADEISDFLFQYK